MTTARTVHVSVAALRRAAGVVRRMTGLRVEIAELPPATAACGPPRCGKHAANVELLSRALRSRLPPGRAVVDGAGVDLSGTAGGGYVVPDLVVCPAVFLTADQALLPPQDVDLAVEVVTPFASAARIREAVDRYAAAGARALLVVDPRAGRGRWSLYTEPVAGHHGLVRRGWGEPVPLPDPFLPGGLPVGGLPRYARR